MRTGVALGSNLGDRKALLLSAIHELMQIADLSQPFLVSNFLETEPVDCPPGSPNFLNAVVEFTFSGTPETLLQTLQSLESKYGRETIRPKNSPRPLDLDILYCDDLTLNSPALCVPHPRMFQRRFVLEPLASILPNRWWPQENKTTLELLADL